MEENQRLASLILLYVFQGKNVEQSLSIVLKQIKSDQVSIGAVKSYIYGVLRFGWQLTFILRRLCKKAPPRPIEYILLIAFYQLIYTHDEAFSVVSQAVNAAMKLESHALKPFVNGVLRTFLREKEKLMSQVMHNEEAVFNHPQWWINKIKQQYPLNWINILEQAQKRAPFTLRVNQQYMVTEEYLNKLADKNLDVTWHGQQAVILSTPCPVDQLPDFNQGAVSVQDLSAQYAASYMDLFRHARVLDACAAPGGKTCHLLENNPHIDLLVLDKSPERLQRVKDNIKRLDLPTPSLGIKAEDAQNVTNWWDGILFDRILLDVPCTGSGVVRRHPDIKWLRRESDIKQLVTEQKVLLTSLWPLLKSKGKLVYVTCSIFKEETSEQIQAFLDQHADATMLNGTDPEDGFITPDSRHDGFYYAVCQKN